MANADGSHHQQRKRAGGQFDGTTGKKRKADENASEAAKKRGAHPSQQEEVDMAREDDLPEAGSQRLAQCNEDQYLRQLFTAMLPMEATISNANGLREQGKEGRVGDAQKKMCRLKVCYCAVQGCTRVLIDFPMWTVRI